MNVASDSTPNFLWGSLESTQ